MDSSLSLGKLCCSPKSNNEYCSDIHIPDVLIYDILSRLPSNCLMRLRCVCKAWHALISHDLEFHKLHLLNSSSKTNGPCWIGYQVGESCGYDSTKFWLYDKSFVSNKIQACHIHREERPPVDFFFSRIIGSSNGIVCLYLPADEESLGITDKWGFRKFVICLWNPSIRKYKRLDFPWKANDIHEFNNNFMLGFGFSMKSSVCKVVVICKDERREAHVYVYSMRTSSWTEIGAKPDGWLCEVNKDCGTYFNGSSHWIRLHIKQGDYSIFSFNLDDYNFRYINLPPKSKLSPPHDCFKTVICMDMLAAWETIEVGVSFAVNIWVMKEYGNCSSWSFFQSVLIKEDYWFQHRYFRLFGIDANGRLLFTTTQDDSPLRSCNSQSGEIKEFQSRETVDIWGMAPYQESLFLL